MNIQLRASKLGARLPKIALLCIAHLAIFCALAIVASHVARADTGADSAPVAGELFEVGNQVWFDTNGNGLKEGSEQGVPGVQVTLLDGVGNPYDIDPTLAGTQGYTSTTNGNGDYLFINLITDTYRIGIDALNFQPGGALESYAASEVSSVTPDDNVDGDSNGIQVGTLAQNGLFSGPITLNAANSPTFSNTTVDFGFYTLMLGSRVWTDFDNNGLFGQRESGSPNVTVNLLDGAGMIIDTMQTDSSGLYTFTGVISGTYIVEVIPPSGYVSSTGGGEESSPMSNGDENDNGLNLLVGSAIQSAQFTMTPGDIGAAANNILINETGTTNNPTIDFGLWEYMNVGHIVWQDTNNDGVIDPSEPGIDGVTVELYQDNGDGVLDTGADTLIGNTVTANGGFYGFDSLASADYFIHIATPSTLYPSSSTPAQLDDVGIQTISGSPTSSALITLENDPNVAIDDGTNGTSSDMFVNFGFFAPATIGNMAWYDYEQDGLQVTRDDGVPSVDVILYDSNNNVVAAMTTDSDGGYNFENITPGEYYIIFIPPSGYEISPQDVGSNDAIDSDVDVLTGRTPLFTIESGTTTEEWDIGLYIPTRLGNYVWFDADGDGIQGTDPAETPLANVLVEVFDTAGNLITQTITISTGEYSLEGLIPGDYVLTFTALGGLVPVLPDAGTDDTKDSDISTTDFSVTTTLTSGENERKIDAGFSDPNATQPASLGGWTWFDADGDGIRGTDPAEMPFAGVRVQLFNAGGVLIGEATTDAIGFYQFDDLAPGSYYTEFEAGAGQVFVPPNTGGDDMADSDVDPATGATPLITLESGESNTSVSGGLYETASIGDYVWHDINADGTQGAPTEEEPMGGVTVALRDGNGTLVAQTTTDADGLYSFTNLIPGEYYLSVTPPSDYIITTPDQAEEGTDSDADPATGNTAVTILLPGENDMNWDFGLLTPAEFRNPDNGNPDGNPNAVNLSSFTVQQDPNGSATIVVQWETSAEIDTLGFYILRSRDDGFRSARTLSSYMTPSKGTQGGVYEVSFPYNPVLDPPLSGFTFWLVEMEVSGESSYYQARMIDGQSASQEYDVFLPLLNQ